MLVLSVNTSLRVVLIKVMFSFVKFPKDCQAYGVWADIDIVRVSKRASLQMKALLLRFTNIWKAEEDYKLLYLST
jgi:hypothetical protein